MKAPDDLPIYTVGKVAQLARVPAQTIRDWQRQGLLNPARTKGKHRLFSETDLRRIMMIRKLHREEGVKLSAIGELLARQENVVEEAPRQAPIRTLEREMPPSYLTMPYSNIAMESLAAYAAKREEAEISSSLLKAATTIAGLGDLDPLLDAVASMTMDMVGLGRSLVYMWDEDKHVFLRAKARPSSNGESHDDHPFTLGRDDVPAVDELLRSKVPLLIEDTNSSPLIPKRFVEEFGFRSILLVPLASRNEVVGALLVDEPGYTRRFSFKEIALVQGIANLAANAIQSMRSYERAQRDLRMKEHILNATHLDISDSLSSMVSLLDVETKEQSTGVCKEHLESTIRRVQNVATVHRALAENPGSKVLLTTLVGYLTQSVRAQFAGQGKRVRIQVSESGLEILQTKATSLGVVLGELLAQLTAFPFAQDEEAVVVIEAQQQDSQAKIGLSVLAASAREQSFERLLSPATKDSLYRTVHEQLHGEMQLSENKPEAFVSLPLNVPVGTN